MNEPMTDERLAEVKGMINTFSVQLWHSDTLKALIAHYEAIRADRDNMQAALDEFLIEYDNEVARTPQKHSSIEMIFARENDLVAWMREASR